MTRRLAQRGTLTLALTLVAVVTFAGGIALAAWTERTQLDATAGAAPSFAPTLLLVPAVSGTPVDGEVLTATPGVWTGLSPSATHQFQWWSCDPGPANCASVSTATSTPAGYTVPTNGYLKRYLMVETVSNGSFSTVAASLPTRPQTLLDINLALVRVLVVAYTDATKANRGMPVLSGTAKSGSTLSVTAGEWGSKNLLGALTAPLGNPVVSYQWMRCGPVGNTGWATKGTAGCTAISGATAATYTAVGLDVGERLRVRTTYTRSLLSALGISLGTFAAVVDTQATDVVVP